MRLPRFYTYCDSTTARNALCFEFGSGLAVWYSYNTPVAFHLAGQPRMVRENDWGPTTGKHLNAIDGGDKSSRVPGAEFEKALGAAVRTYDPCALLP